MRNFERYEHAIKRGGLVNVLEEFRVISVERLHGNRVVNIGEDILTNRDKEITNWLYAKGHYWSQESSEIMAELEEKGYKYFTMNRIRNIPYYDKYIVIGHENKPIYNEETETWTSDGKTIDVQKYTGWDCEEMDEFFGNFSKYEFFESDEPH
jgi:succinate dehydrogenase flavin-adding protein (antitoxin of CptAB toxin-antitoxin module)